MIKKGIMVDFLVTVLLAIFIFAPACYMLSKVFNLSDQAKDSFESFATDLQKFIFESNKGQERSVVLILDAGTFVALFDQKSIDSRTKLQIEGGLSYAENNFAYPQEQCQGFTCLCLCRNYEKKEKLICNSLTCHQLKDSQGKSIPFTHPWVSIRMKDDTQRRIVATIQNTDAGIEVRGGNTLVREQESEIIEYDEPPVPG